MVDKQRQQQRNPEGQVTRGLAPKCASFFRVLLMIASFASLSAASIGIAFTIIPNTGFANNASAPASIASSYMQAPPYRLTQSANAQQTTQAQNVAPQQSSSAISPAPLSLVALLLIVIAAAIRRHQNQL